MAQHKPSAAAFVSGLAWVLIILSGWALLRLGYNLVTSFEDTDSVTIASVSLPKWLFQGLIIMHLVLAASSIYAASAMLKFRAWTRPYFATTMMSIGVEAIVFGAIMAGSAGDGLPGEQSIRWVSAGAVALLGLTAMLLGWKLLRDPAIRSVLVQR